MLCFYWQMRKFVICAAVFIALIGFVVFRTTTFCLSLNSTWKYGIITFLLTSRTFPILNPSWNFQWKHFCCSGLQGHSEGSEGVRSAGDHFDIEVIVDISKTRWSYSDTVAKMTRRWDFPLRKSSFLTGLRWERDSFFDDLTFQPDLSSGKSRRREQTTVASPSKTRSAFYSMLSLKLKPPPQAMARSPLPLSSPTSLLILFSSAPTSQKIPQT